MEGIKQLCVLCKKIASNSHLVRNGSAQCLPMGKSAILTWSEMEMLSVYLWVSQKWKCSVFISGLVRNGNAQFLPMGKSEMEVLSVYP